MIKDNPFYILGATTRDNRQKIVELAEDKSFEMDEDICQKARGDLTIPRNRILAELNWFPGVSPRRIEQLIDHIENNSKEIIHTEGLPILASINLLSTVLNNDNFLLSSDELEEFIVKIIDAYENIDIDTIIRDINEDREISSFPEIKDFDYIENEINNKKRACIKLILKRLNNLETLDLLKVMTKIVDDETLNGEFQASSMVDDLVDDYKLHTQDFLEQEYEKIKQLIEVIRNRAQESESAIEPLVDRLIKITNTWDDVAQPIQLSTKSRGLNDQLSMDVAHTVRSLGVDLFNDYGYMELSKRISEALRELFAELPEVLERIEDDIDILDDLFHKRQAAEHEHQQWLDDLSYSTEIGMVFKDTLSISSKGVSWKNRTYPLESISRITWGAISHSVNGVPTGTTYTISFGNQQKTAQVETRRVSVYNEFTSRLWKTAGITILTNILKDFKNGEGLTLGKCTIWDDGVTLIQSGWFSSNEKKKFTWSEIQVWSANGNFVIAATNEKKFSAEMAYLEVYNIHFLESAIRMMFKDQNARKLSDLL